MAELPYSDLRLPRTLGPRRHLPRLPNYSVIDQCCQLVHHNAYFWRFCIEQNSGNKESKSSGGLRKSPDDISYSSQAETKALYLYIIVAD